MVKFDTTRKFRYRTRRRAACVVAAALWLVGGGEVTAQANNQAEESDRIDLGRLAEGPAIFGGGIVFGEPTGITAKLWFTETGFGLDAAVAWSFQDDTSLHLHANALAHLALIETEGGRYIVPYIGLGVTNTYGDDTSFGLRVPVGLSLLPFPTFPIEFFAELAPGVGLIPETDAEFGAGIGARFYIPL
ncbi:MAG: hypothetical protein MI724_11630 [Spirochaetales bacterium]|nr:hypothetical protein [Spirochaetales bacterium]